MSSAPTRSSSSATRRNGTWRNAYLLGAHELRNGVAPQPSAASRADFLKGVTIDLAFDFLGVRLNAPKAEGKHIVNWTFTDLNESHVMNPGKLGVDAHLRQGCRRSPMLA